MSYTTADNRDFKETYSVKQWEWSGITTKKIRSKLSTFEEEMLVIIIIYFFVQYYKVQDIQRNKNKKIKNNFKKYKKGPVDKAIILNRKIDKASK